VPKLRIKRGAGAAGLIEKASVIVDARHKSEVRALRRTVQDLTRQAATDANRAEIVAALKSRPRRPVPLRYKKNLHRRVATPVILCSDWHVGERVRADKVNGTNHYDQHEAAHRAHRLATALLWLNDHHRNGFEIREQVVWLGGDLITGFLHPDQAQSNTLPPNKEVLLVQDLVGHLLDSVLSMPGMERVTVVCNYGNHGRTTPKPQIATGAENSFEWLLYHQIARNYAKDSRVDFQIANGEFSRLRVHRTDLGFTHGDAIKYGGGVGGVMVPVMRALPRWDSYGACDMWNMGHFHWYHSLPRVTINSSMIGVSPYGMRVGSNEPPSQAYYLVDSERGPCHNTAVWLTGGKK
jgi:hypothetical protein